MSKVNEFHKNISIAGQYHFVHCSEPHVHVRGGRRLEGGGEDGLGGDEAVGEPEHDDGLPRHHREQQPDLPLAVTLHPVHLPHGR